MKLKQAFNGLCLPASWYEPYQFEVFQYQPQICPDFLHITARRNSDNVALRIRLNFNGRGWAANPGAGCGEDDYITFPAFPEVSAEGANGLKLAVWQAHLDAVWASSVTIDVTAVNDFGAVASTIYVQRFNTLDDQVTKVITSETGTLNCGTTVKGTITVNDDGTFSIA
jgi:hypothetical protein